MIRCRLITLIAAGLLFACSSSKSTADRTTILPYPKIVSIYSPSQVHGIGFARLSSFNPDRSFKEARENAITDLESSLLTSVYLEYYGDNTISSKLRAEFGISEHLEADEFIALDSLTVNDWAVYYLTENSNSNSFPRDAIAHAQKANWTEELNEPKIINGYWVASGFQQQTRFNPDRGWTKAKQHALQNLSEYLNTKVQSLQKTFDNTLTSVHYVTSKHIFSQIGVIDRKIIGDQYHVLIMIRESDIIRIDKPVEKR